MTARREEKMQSRERNAYVSLTLRIAVSVVLVGALAYAVGTTETIAQLRSARWEIIALVITVLASHVFVVAPRWALILRALGHRTRSLDLIGSVFLGFLFNQVLPTAVGGDALRAWRARHLGVPLELAIHSVLIDRASGIAVVLVGTALLLPVVSLTAASEPFWRAVAITAAAGLIWCAGLWLLSKMAVVSIPLIGRLQHALGNFVASTRALLRRPALAVGVAALAIAGQFIVIGALWLLAKEMQVFLPLIDIAIVTFGAMLASAIPISIAGWGIREGTLIFLLGAYGVPAEKTFAISVLFGACMMIAALPGVLFLLSQRNRISDPDDR